MKKSGHIFFITGVSGAGKNTLIHGLKEKMDISFIKSVKTRELRPWELDGIDYIKYSKEEFEAGIANGEFLEYNFVHQQNYYGTRIEDVGTAIEKGGIYIKEVDPLILPELLAAIAQKREYFSFLFLDLPVEEIRNRLIARGDTVDDENYQHRIDSAKQERQMTNLADHIIDGKQAKARVLDEVVDIIKKYI